MKKDYFSQKSPSASLHRSMFILQQKADDLLAESAGAGLSQVRIMSQLHYSVPRSQRTLATMLGQTEANVSRQLRQMKKQALVNIDHSQKDRRVREVTLTSKGAKVYDKAQKVLDDQLENITKMLGRSEAKTFQKAIELLNHSL